MNDSDTALDRRIAQLSERIESLAAASRKGGAGADAREWSTFLGAVVSRLEEARSQLTEARATLAALRPILEGLPGERFERQLLAIAGVERVISQTNEALALAGEPR
jgi:hypothetical protein